MMAGNAKDVASHQTVPQTIMSTVFPVCKIVILPLWHSMQVTLSFPDYSAHTLMIDQF